MSIPIIDIAGSAGERGIAHGHALAESHCPVLRALDEPGEQRSPTDRRAQTLLPFAVSLLPESRAQAPDLVEEVEGIAEGAGLPFEKVWFLNCFDEAAGYWLYRRVNLGRACTTFAATGQSTLASTTYIGQSWDINEWYESVLLRIAPGDDEPGALLLQPSRRRRRHGDQRKWRGPGLELPPVNGSATPACPSRFSSAWRCGNRN